MPTYRNVKTLPAHGDIVCKRHVGRNERIHTSNHAGSNPAALILSLTIKNKKFNLEDMGFLTTITIKNDRLGEFEEKPLEFAKMVFDGINQANYEHKEVSLCGNYLNIQPSRHADDETVYVHTGNGVFNLNPYNNDFKELAQRNPKLALDFVQRAERILKEAKKRLDKKE